MAIKNLKDLKNIFNRHKIDAGLSEAHSYLVKFSDYLSKNEHAGLSFILILGGLFMRYMLSKEQPTQFLDWLFYPIGDVMSFAFTGAGLIFCFEVILSEKYQKKIPNEILNFIICSWVSIILFSKILNVYNFNSVLFISAFIIFAFFVRVAFLSICMFAVRSNKLPDENKQFISGLSFGLIWMFLWGLSYINFLFYKILIFFMVYGIYYLVKEKYLVESIKTPKGNIFFINNIFSEVANLSTLISIIVFTIFLLFNYGIFTVSAEQPTLYYFYSTTAQVFAALLGIVVMFSVFILQKGDNCNEEKRKFLKKGLKGFTILYTVVIIFSITGILVKDSINLNPMEKIPTEFDINMFRDMLNVFIFESIILMVPAALLYLYGMISDFLYSEAEIESPSGQPVAINPETLKMVEGADRVKVKIKMPEGQSSWAILPKFETEKDKNP